MSAKSQKARPDLKLDENQLKGLRHRLRDHQLAAGDYALLLTIVELVVQLKNLTPKAQRRPS